MRFDVIDRRKNPKGKSLVNRRRFLRRHRRQMEDAVRKKIRESDVKDIATGKPKKIKISTKDTTEQPVFRHGDGGVIERVLPGNREYLPGDTILRPSGGGGLSTKGAPDGEGEDNFAFEVSQEEFLQYFFDGLELPDMVKKVLSGDAAFKVQRAGFSTDGAPSNLDLLRTMRHSQARRAAFRMPKLRKKRELEKERDRLVSVIENANGSDVSAEKEHPRFHRDSKQLAEIEAKLKSLERKLAAIPFIDDVDVRYRRHERVPIPVSQAVMFCLLDVSGSMGPWEKEIAKRFFMLLYLFLTRNYDTVDVVFIRHHHTAKEVDEEEFFKSRESGGTVVSSALKLMGEIIDERYPLTQWNIYGCQASDGDNFMNDLPVTHDLIANTIMPLVQYYAYVEVVKRQNSELWSTYQKVGEMYPNFAMARITDAKDIYPVFRGLFEAGKSANK